MNETPESGPGATASARTGSRADLDAYVAANTGTYTDDVLYQTLVEAGYPADDVRAALARASAGHRPQRTGSRAARIILVAYVAVFAVLSLGMLLNSRPAGHLMPSGPAAIPILAGALGLAFAASLVWVASRRLSALLILLVVGLYALAALTGGGGGLLIGVVLAILAVGGIVAILRVRNVNTGREPDLALLLVIPTLLLLGVAGICVASGLPIPGTA
jgi:hypothetical protein